MSCQERVHDHRQFVGVEGLPKIVHRSSPPDDIFVHRALSRGEYQDRHVVRIDISPHLVENLRPTNLGHRHIEDQQVGPAPLESIESGLPVANYAHDVTGLPKCRLNNLGNDFIIFSIED